MAIFVQTAVDALAQLGIVDRGVGAPATLQRLCIEQRLERRTRLARRLHRIDADTMRMRVIGARVGAHAIAVEIDDQHRALPRTVACQIAQAFTQKRFRSEEHTSELQSLMRNSYAVFCLKK